MSKSHNYPITNTHKKVSILRAQRSREGGGELLLPLSFAQQRLWFLAQMQGVGEAYHISGGLWLRGRLDRGVLRRALDCIVARHEALRTCFVQLDGQPWQRIAAAEEVRFHLREQDLRRDGEAAARLMRIAGMEAATAFDLERGPLVRGLLVRMEEDRYALLVTMHHIVSDGWSMEILVRELSTLYGAFSEGEADPLLPLAIQYGDYAVWQRERAQGEEQREQAEYWKRTLAGAPPLLELPTDRPRPAQQDYAGAFAPVVLDAALTAGLRELTRERGTTLLVTLLAGWGAVLGRLANQRDVVIGTPTTNRRHAEIEPLIGFFVNTLALRIDLSGGPTVEELLGRVKEQELGAQHNQDLPFEQVVETLQPERSTAHSPVFQVMLAWQNAPGKRMELPGLKMESLAGPERRTSIFDLMLVLEEQGDVVAGGVEYATALFDADTIGRYLGYFRSLLRGMVGGEAGERAIDQLEILSREEREQVLSEWNRTEREYPGKCVHELFEEQAARTPEAAAVEYEGRKLSYRELNGRANQLGKYLRNLGVGPEVRVAICLDRSLEVVVGLLAILKAGGAYVPLDPGYPPERLRFMAEDARAAVLLTERKFSELLRWSSAPKVYVDEQWIGIAEESGAGIGVNVHLENLTYVIYTSGSSGRPKGVAVTHGGLANYLNWAVEAYAPDMGAGSIMHSSLSFDLTITSIYPVLLSGGCVKVLPQAAGIEELAESLESGDYSLLKLTPSHVQALGGLLEDCGNGGRGSRVLVIGGEALKYGDLDLWRRQAPGIRLINEYGPTETVVGCVSYEVGSETGAAEVPIGKPIGNTRVYVLDENLEPVPVGVVGELCIAGSGVARGYLDRPELTAERFIPNPFSRIGGHRLYRTGDRARWRKDGNLEFLGRLDHQVKVRGYRIELGEIESALLNQKGVAQAVVVVRGTSGAKVLTAYVVLNEPVAIPDLENSLREILPVYSIPAAFIVLDAFTLTPNGKIDRGVLTDRAVGTYVRGRERTQDGWEYRGLFSKP